MRNIQKQLNQLNNDLKRCMDECKDIYTKHVERLQRERDTALLAASQMEDPNNISAQLPPGVEISNKKVRMVQMKVEAFTKSSLVYVVRQLQSRRDGWMFIVSENTVLFNLLST